MRVRVLQTAPVLGAVDVNLAAIREAVVDSAESDLVVTPELATHGYDLGRIPNTRPLQIDDRRFRDLGEHGPAVIVGFAEDGRRGPFNSAALLGAGEPVVQRKLTLPTYRGWEERKHFVPGGRIRTSQVAGAAVSALICNDIWQPQLAWIAAHQGAEVLVAPTNSVVSDVGLPVSEAWELQLRGLAVSLQCYIVFANRSGEEPCGRFWGGSTVYGPTGQILARAGDGEEVLDVDLDLEGLREARRVSPLLRESRADVVLRAAQRMLDEEAEEDV